MNLEEIVLQNIEQDEPPVAISSALTKYFSDKATVDASKN
jgi:hypothetical protein